MRSSGQVLLSHSFILAILVIILPGGILCSQTKAADTVAWAITKEALFTADGEPATPEVELLMSKLHSKRSPGTHVTTKEFLALLERPESHLVYSNALIRYATPLSMDIQTKEHKDLATRLLSDSKQKAGVEFMKVHRKILDRAEERYHVSRQDIVGVLAWESGLGTYTGDYRIFNVFLGQILFLDTAQKIAISRLAAKGVRNPMEDSVTGARERKRFSMRKMDAIGGLAALLRMSKHMKIDPLAVLGSWGGAIGYVQFMPYSMTYAVDADRNGLDLKTWPDAIFSIANYLKVRGRYKKSEEGRRRALLAYNRNGEYANGVMALADSIWEKYSLQKTEIVKADTARVKPHRAKKR